MQPVKCHCPGPRTKPLCPTFEIVQSTMFASSSSEMAEKQESTCKAPCHVAAGAHHWPCEILEEAYNQVTKIE